MPARVRRCRSVLEAVRLAPGSPSRLEAPETGTYGRRGASSVSRRWGPCHPDVSVGRRTFLVDATPDDELLAAPDSAGGLDASDRSVRVLLPGAAGDVDRDG